MERLFEMVSITELFHDSLFPMLENTRDIKTSDCLHCKRKQPVGPRKGPIWNQKGFYLEPKSVLRWGLPNNFFL